MLIVNDPFKYDASKYWLHYSSGLLVLLERPEPLTPEVIESYKR